MPFISIIFFILEKWMFFVVLREFPVSDILPMAYPSANCGYDSDESDKGDWELIQTSVYLALQPTGHSDSSVTWLLEDYVNDMKTFFGGSTNTTCWL